MSETANKLSSQIARILAPLVSQPWFAPMMFLACGAAGAARLITKGAAPDSAAAIIHETADIVWTFCGTSGVVSAGLNEALLKRDERKE